MKNSKTVKIENIKEGRTEIECVGFHRHGKIHTQHDNCTLKPYIQTNENYFSTQELNVNTLLAERQIFLLIRKQN